ncbi:hypothetical protein OF83DRAFT_1118983, partial [Amylostereum chailletii]
MTQVVRTPQIDLAALLSAPNPSIDLKLESYEASTRNFLKAVTNYTNRSVTEITQHRNAYHAEKKKLAERSQHTDAEISAFKMKEIELAKQLEKENAETKDARDSVTARTRQLAAIREACSALDGEIEQHRAVVTNLRREKGAERDSLEAHAQSTSPELFVCEEDLGCFIEGVGRDQLLIRFADLRAPQKAREFSLVLDMSSTMYR